MRLIKAAIWFLTIVIVSATAQMQNSEVIAQAYSTVNVRNGPGTEYDIIGQLNSGNEVPITGRSNNESDWLRINFEDKEGWLAYFTVTIVGDVNDLPIVEALADRTGLSSERRATPLVRRSSSNTFASAFRRVNVRSGPGIEFQRIGVLEPDSTADITGRTADDEWLQIDYQGQRGWIAYFVVSITGSLDDITVAAIPITAATRIPPAVELVARYNLNFRTKPTIGAPVIDVIPFGTTLTTDARADDAGAWLRVTYDGEQGWLLSSLVTIRGSLSTLPIVPPVATISSD